MNALEAFVPRLAVEMASSPGPTHALVEGSMLSADISGFTALSEKLAGKGKAGAEEITELINVCFTALIDAAYGYDGEIIKFGGDALLVLFRGNHHGRRCANAALAMQIALHASPTAKRAKLDMTVGASHGPFDVFLAGTDYRDLLVIGPAASEVIHLEGEAEKGETLVSDDIAASLPPEMLGRRHAGGVAIGGAPIDPPTAPVWREAEAEQLDAFVPQRVREQLEAFSELGGEHRLVAVGFVMVGGISGALAEIGPDGTAAALSSLVDDVIAASTSYGVTALHTDIAADGFKFVLCAGAPVNPGDISDALLNAALAISRVDTRFTLRQGAQTGRVFAGFLGAPHRRTYTLMGDPVNTAARMLGKSGDREIVAVATMVDDTRAVFETDAIPPFHVKGKIEPIEAYHVRGVSDAVRRDGAGTRLFGRDDELEILSKAIGELGEIVDIVGPAGVGKSRLLDAAFDAAEGLLHFHGSCTPYGAASPYSVFRPLLRSGIGIDVRAGAAEAGRHLRILVQQRAPELLPMLPLLAVPFGAEVESTPEADAIDAEFRRARIHDAVLDFYDITLAGRPVFMVIEDLHWVDDASGDLVNHLIRAAATRPWAGIMTRRPEGEWELAGDLPHVTTLRLDPLDDDDIRQLAIDSSIRSLADATIDLIVERSQGNPLFALELARAASRGDGAELPESVEQVISATIDDLSPGLRQLVRIASVAGNSFDLEDLAPLLAEAAPGYSVDDPHLADIMEPRGATTWAFRHALYRDAAYEGLPFRHRLRLHRSVGESIESHADDPADVASLLSVHFSIGRVHDKAWIYSLIAARHAAAQRANVEAEAAYERALAAARFAGATNRERMAVAEALGDARFVVARFADARSAYEAARRLATDVAEHIRLARKLGSVSEREGNVRRAMRWYRKAGRLDAGVEPTPAILSESAQAKLAEAGILHRQGDQHGCRHLAEEARAGARRAKDRQTEALALERMHLALTYLRDPNAHEIGEAALAIYRDIDDDSGIVRTLINLGIEAYFAGQWTQASERYLEATETGRRASSVVLAETAALNTAEILSDQGHWDRAIHIFEDARRNWEAVGYPVGVAAATSFLAVAQMRSGRLDEAHVSLKNARVDLEGLGLAELVDDVRARDVEWQLLAGEPVIEAAAGLLRELGTDHPLACRVLRTLGVAYALDGDEQAAADALTRSIELAGDDTYESAECRRALANALPTRPDAVEQAAAAAAIFERLDVAQPPPLPAALAR